MNATVLSTDIKANLESAFGLAPGGFNDAAMQKACDAIAEAVVNHITTSAVVTVSVLAVTPGSGTAAGTGTVA